MHFEIYLVHSPTNALFINLVKSFECTLKYTIISLLHVSVFNPLNAELSPICHLLALLGARHILHVSRIRVNDHQRGALSVPNNSYICVKTLGKLRRYIYTAL